MVMDKMNSLVKGMLAFGQRLVSLVNQAICPDISCVFDVLLLYRRTDISLLITLETCTCILIFNLPESLFKDGHPKIRMMTTF